MHISDFYDKTISSVTVNRDGTTLTVLFSDCTSLVVQDAMQHCCEERYFHTEDDLNEMAGKIFCGFSVRNGGSEYDDEEEMPVLDSMFIEIQTEDFPYTITAYNAHNGEYAGFDIHVRSTKGHKVDLT